MKPFELTRREAIALLGGALSTAAILPAQAPARDLLRGFLEPPHAAKPWVFWFWLNGHLSKEGITGDLEALKKAGIGGVLIMSIAAGVEPGPVRFLTAEWRDIFRHMVAEADRLGIEVDMNNDDGWDCGGPWIKPEHAMQKMVWTETRVRGPGKQTLGLPHPDVVRDYYREVCVLAFPTPPEEEVRASSRAVAAPGATPCLELEFAGVVTVRSMTVSASKDKGKPGDCELLASEDGREFRAVAKFDTGWRGPMAAYREITFSLPPVRGRSFRLLLHGAQAPAEQFIFSLNGGERVAYWQLKTGHTSIREHGGGFHLFGWPDKSQEDTRGAISRSAIVDLSSRLTASSLLEWEVPAGNWTILRIGHTATGKLNGAATKEGSGLDCDKFTRAGVDHHFPGMMAKLIADNELFIGRSLKWFHNDSWEAGCQNWSSTFREDFRRLRGYDLLPYLPVMAGGRVVGSRDTSERFLWDLRRTMADLIRDVYWARLRELCHQHGLKLTIEAAGRQQFLYDPVNLLSQGDLPLGEFWVGEEWARPDCKLAASVAHITGGNIAGAESFTSNYACGNAVAGWWQDSPFSLKAKGDHAFCAGVNRIVFHRFLHQPRDAKPGMAWPEVGTNIDRTQTWWEPAAASWFGYLARCQYLLQQGRFVADFCVLTGEGAPNAALRKTRNGPRAPEGADASTYTEGALLRTGKLNPIIPAGYDFDACSPDTVAHLRVVENRLELPSGMSYAALVLPDCPRMTPGLLRRIKALVAAGATVVGPKPQASPSLADNEAADREGQSLAAEVWGDCDGRTVTEHAFGKGRVVWGVPLQELLAADFVYTSAGSDMLLDYVHRTLQGTEIYFVSNQSQHDEEVECSFRVSGKHPQLWDADTGQVREVFEWREAAGRTIVPLRLDPAGSIFVIFADPASAVHAKPMPKISLPPPVRVAGPWRLCFPPGWGAPAEIVLDKLISWSDHAEDGVRHFSGAATYTAEVDMPTAPLPAGAAWHLDLGQVKEVAEVRLNGASLGALWKPPFILEISKALKPGRNRIEIRVANLWPNRLIGDAALPPERRYTSTNWNPYTPGHALFESGLLGPVLLIASARHA